MAEVALVVPLYNEESNVEPFYEEVAAHCDGLDFRIIFVNDGSSDRTADACRRIAAQDARVSLVSLVTNAGHQRALHAGLSMADADYVIMMDGDLQHPPRLIPQMLETARSRGVDVVDMVKRQTGVAAVKRAFSWAFYRFFNAIADTRIEPGASDFRLISRRVLRVLQTLRVRRPFYRALIPHLSFPSTTIEYSVAPRRSGSPTYTFRKSLVLGADAFLYHTTFSLRLMTVVGTLLSVLAMLYLLFSIYVRFAYPDKAVPGWADIICSVLLLGGMNLIFLSVIGRYIMSLVEHAGALPMYVVDHEASVVQEPGAARAVVGARRD